MISNHRLLRHLRYALVGVTLVFLYLHLSQRLDDKLVDNLIIDNDDLLGNKKIPVNSGGHGFGSFFNSFLGHEKDNCPNYVEYSKERHAPLSTGSLKLPFQRPKKSCRTYVSPAVEKVIEDFKVRLKDPDLARLFENCLPNTLDTTVLWHKKAEPKKKKKSSSGPDFLDFSIYTQSFIVTGDIHAEWLRDSTWQLSAYQKLAKYDDALKDLIRGAINTQARFIVLDPYCNAFQPPIESKVKRENSAIDDVFPKPNWKNVFECKWELDSLVSFLALVNQYYEATHDDSIFNDLWEAAVKTILLVLQRESVPSFSPNGDVLPFRYTFQRNTNIGSETLPLTGSGNPVNFNTKMVRSAFRPSDDACTYQLFIPANAYLVAELNKLNNIIRDKPQFEKLNSKLVQFATNVNQSIYDYGVFTHPEFGQVFAYEVDGYNSANFMDDANIPSLLSLPDLGFIDVGHELYQNTRKMILTKRGNPYYIKGRNFQGIGGPHVGYRYAWPMSLLVKIRTSNDDEEIASDLSSVLKNTAFLGLMHEGVNVNTPAGRDFTRPWFAWCNSELGKTILDLAERKPHLIFNKKFANTPYIIDNEFKDFKPGEEAQDI